MKQTNKQSQRKMKMTKVAKIAEVAEVAAAVEAKVKKLSYVQKTWTVAEKRPAYDVLPKQAKMIFDYMVKIETPMTGEAIATGAFKEEMLKTTQAPSRIFAYYVKQLGDAGMVSA
jgi:hypothetical protein